MTVGVIEYKLSKSHSKALFHAILSAPPVQCFVLRNKDVCIFKIVFNFVELNDVVSFQERHVLLL